MDISATPLYLRVDAGSWAGALVQRLPQGELAALAGLEGSWPRPQVHVQRALSHSGVDPEQEAGAAGLSSQECGQS